MNEWISVKDRLPEDFQEVVCYIPGINGHCPGKEWQDSDFCIGQQCKGAWKRMDNENIQVSHWFPLPPSPW